MHRLRPHIFIGSSSEAKAIAEQIKSELSDVAECKIWYKQFDFGNSAYEDLVNKLSLYDYGILVASTDDSTTSRGIKRLSMRDNVLFEFGLFAGRFGRQRSFLFAEEGVKIPSDLNGITLPFFKSAKSRKFFHFGKTTPDLLDLQKKSITESCDQIREHIKKRVNIFDYGFLPSTSLAYGYFNNFVLKAVKNLIDSKNLRIEGSVTGIPFKDVNFTILIPNDLTADMFDRIKHLKTSNNWDLVKIDAGAFRPFDFYIQMDQSKDGIICLSDIPITLNALNDSIKSYIGKSYIGISEAEELLETREIRIFKGVLDYLISSNPLTKDRVKTELVDI